MSHPLFRPRSIKYIVIRTSTLDSKRVGPVDNLVDDSAALSVSKLPKTLVPMVDHDRIKAQELPGGRPTKSRYIAGLQCLRRLWLLVNEPQPYEEPPPGSPKAHLDVRAGRRLEAP